MRWTMPGEPPMVALDDLSSAAANGRQREQSWLAVSCSEAGLLLPLHDAGEIAAHPRCIRVPHTRPWFLGVANLRGQLQGVVDLGGFLGLRPPGGEPSGGWIVALNARLEAGCALRVDQLAGLRHESDLVAIEPASAAGPLADRPRFAGLSFRERTGSRIWQEIRLVELVVDGFFLDILEPL